MGSRLMATTLVVDVSVEVATTVVVVVDVDCVPIDGALGVRVLCAVTTRGRAKRESVDKRKNDRGRAAMVMEILARTRLATFDERAAGVRDRGRVGARRERWEGG
jgi:hypothetical protein